MQIYYFIFTFNEKKRKKTILKIQVIKICITFAVKISHIHN